MNPVVVPHVTVRPLPRVPTRGLMVVVVVPRSSCLRRHALASEHTIQLISFSPNSPNNVDFRPATKGGSLRRRKTSPNLSTRALPPVPPSPPHSLPPLTDRSGFEHPLAWEPRKSLVKSIVCVSCRARFFFFFFAKRRARAGGGDQRGGRASVRSVTPPRLRVTSVGWRRRVEGRVGTLGAELRAKDLGLRFCWSPRPRSVSFPVTCSKHTLHRPLGGSI